MMCHGRPRSQRLSAEAFLPRSQSGANVHIHGTLISYQHGLQEQKINRSTAVNAFHDRRLRENAMRRDTRAPALLPDRPRKCHRAEPWTLRPSLLSPCTVYRCCREYLPLQTSSPLLSTRTRCKHTAQLNGGIKTSMSRPYRERVLIE